MVLRDVPYSFMCVVCYSAFVCDEVRISLYFLTGIKGRGSYSFGDEFVHFNVSIPS